MKTQYFQEIEDVFLEVSGRGLAISEKDRSQIELWFKTGVPMDLVRQVFLDLKAGSNAGKIRSVSYANRAVEQAFLVWRQKQAGRPKSDGDHFGHDTESAVHTWIKSIQWQLESHFNEYASERCQWAIEKLNRLLHSDRVSESSTVEELVYETLWQMLAEERRKGLELEIESRIRKQVFLDEQELSVASAFMRQKLIRLELGVSELKQESSVRW